MEEKSVTHTTTTLTLRYDEVENIVVEYLISTGRIPSDYKKNISTQWEDGDGYDIDLYGIKIVYVSEI